MKTTITIRALTAISVMITGLATLLTLVHAFITGASNTYSFDSHTMWYLLKESGMITWMLLSAAVYVTGLVMLIKLGKDVKSPETEIGKK